MCIDVHKLRLLALECAEESEALNFTLNYIENCLKEFPFDGRLWFQDAILQFSFIPANKNLNTFNSLNSISRSILAKENSVDFVSLGIFFDQKVRIDFSNTLLNLVVSDFNDFIGKGIETWSFLKYFETFLADGEEDFISLSHSDHSKYSDHGQTSRTNQPSQHSVNISHTQPTQHNEQFPQTKLSQTSLDSATEISSFFLFILSFLKISKNHFHFNKFLQISLNAKNPKIYEFWPFFLFFSFEIVLIEKFEISDEIWFKIFQILKGEKIYGMETLNAWGNYKSFLNGTIYQNQNDILTPIIYQMNSEEFSIERDQMVLDVLKYFHHETGQFKEFITLRPDRTLRLGAHFCEQESDSEQERKAEDSIVLGGGGKVKGKNTKALDESIEELRNKLAKLSFKKNSSVKIAEIDYLNSFFILDTNVILSGNYQLKSELLDRPPLFIVPLVVLQEISNLCDQNNEKSVFAQSAWDFLNSILDKLKIYNNYGQLVDFEEIPRQLSLLSITRNLTSNDDQIIDLASQLLQLTPAVFLITEDLNMRLKAKSKKVHAISMNRFLKLCIGGS